MRQELALTHRKSDVDRILTHNCCQHAAVRPDQIADAECGAPDAAGDRSADLGVAEIDRRPLERRLGLQDLRRGHLIGGPTLVDLGLGNVLVLYEFFAALQLDCGVGTVRPGTRQLSLALLDDCVVRRLVDREQEVARLDIGAFLELPLLEETGDAGTQLDRIDGDHASVKAETRRDFGRLHADHRDRWRRGCLRRLGLGLLLAS
jgi:hypothetical protein